MKMEAIKRGDEIISFIFREKYRSYNRKRRQGERRMLLVRVQPPYSQFDPREYLRFYFLSSRKLQTL